MVHLNLVPEKYVGNIEKIETPWEQAGETYPTET